MPIVKSFLTGVSALLVYLLAAGAIIVRDIPKMTPTPPNSVEWVPMTPPVAMLPLIIGAVLVFAVAFYSMFKKSTRLPVGHSIQY